MSASKKARLAFVVGNTTVQSAVVVDGHVDMWTATTHRGLARNLLPSLEVARRQHGHFERPSMAASVNPGAMRKLAAFLAKAGLPRPVLAGKDFPIPLRTDVDTPEKVGVDRLLGALAGYRRTRGPCVVVDCGTAITVNAVSARGVFLGGAILPGLHMMAESLALNTALLPQITLEEKISPIGKNTEDAIAAGVTLGAAGAITRLVGDARRIVGTGAPVLMTGGGAGRIWPYLPQKLHGWEWVRWLVPEGLVLAYGEEWRKR